MPRKAVHKSLADAAAAPGGAAAVDRALSLLSAFREGDTALGLTELAARTRLYKSTVLRLLASLEHGRLMQRLADGRYALGAEIARLSGIYAASFSLEPLLMPLLRELVLQTGESAAFHVRQGDQRLCLYRVDSPQSIRDHIKAGDVLPLNRGAGGRVLTAFSGGRGKRYAQIRREQVLVSVGDRTPGLAGISAPVFDAGGNLVGALTLTMPAQRLKREQAKAVLAMAKKMSAALGGSFPAPVRADRAAPM